MKRPKISVIIAVYGVEAYIERCARSLFEQTLDSIEFLFIDDCSPDNSIAILENILSQYPVRQEQTRILRMPQNSGQAKVRNWAIQQAKGEYIIHCDSDDWVDLDLYEKLYNKAKEDNADIVVFPFINTDGVNKQPLPFFPFADRNHITNNLGDWENEGSLCNKLIRSTLYGQEIDFPQNNFGEDMCLVYQLIYYAHKISVVENIYYYIFKNIESKTRSLSQEKVYRNFLEGCANCRIVEDFYIKHHVDDCNTQRAIKRLKYSKREILRPIVGLTNYHKIWCETFPEIDNNLLFESAFSMREKLKSFCIRFRLFPIPWRKYTTSSENND